MRTAKERCLEIRQIPTVQTVMSDPYYFSKISLFRFALIPSLLTTSSEEVLIKCFGFPHLLHFHLAFLWKWRSIAWCIENISTCKGGFCALCCKRTIKINHKNYLDSKILWSLHISPGRKPEPSPYSQKNPNQPPGNKREALRSWRSKDTSDPFISTTNVLITYHADVKLYIHISNSEKGQHIIHE